MPRGNGTGPAGRGPGTGRGLGQGGGRGRMGGRGLIPASPSKGQNHESPKGGAAQSIFSAISDVVGEGPPLVLDGQG